ncbi:MAG: DUF2480 family protein [Flavobacteriales bacterium]
MCKKVVNRIEKSPLVTLDLEDFYPKEKRVVFDLSQWLHEGLVLKEKDFREKIKQHNWSQYKDQFIALTCSTEVVIPSWAFMLIALHLQDYAKYVVQGNLDRLEEVLFHDIIWEMDVEPYRDKPVIIKGCRNLPIPENAYILLLQKIKPVVKSLMYGEACSTVPLYKKVK